MARWSAVAMLTMTPLVASAQAPGIQLRFHPAPGSLMRTQTDFDVTATYVGLPAVPDSETGTLSMRLMVSRRPQSRAPVWLTTITLDSARAISKFDNQGRKDVPLPFDGTPVNFQFDSAMSTLPVTEGPIGPAQLPDTARRAFTKALAPVFLLPLPRGAASAGTTWTADQPVPLSDLMPTGVPGAVSGPRVLTAHVNAKLDSLVSRGTDTLAYVSYSGTFEPVQSSYRDSTGVTSITVAGAIAASQIWSTAWSGWVSGGLRARAEIKLHNESADAVISADITARMQVRP